MEQRIKALLIEDDKQMCEILEEYLRGYLIEVVSFRIPSEGVDALLKGGYDILVLDLTLPQTDGLEICKAVRTKSDIPIIITSARNAISDRVLGLELGADDYLPKPFDPRELVARIRVQHRRGRSSSISSISSKQGSDIVLKEKTMEIFRKERKLELTPAEFEVLEFFIKNPNIVFSRDAIVDNVVSMKWESVGKSVDVIIGRIRQKIGDDGKNPRYIKAIKGFGYKFVP